MIGRLPRLSERALRWFIVGSALAGLGVFLGCGTASRPQRMPLRSPSGGSRPTSTPAASPAGPGAGVAAASAWGREADRWLGTPYRLGGNDRGGIDCSGFALQLHRSVARVMLPRTTATQYQFGRPVSRRDLRPGDLVFFDTLGRGVSHVGVMVGADRFAHASTSRGVMYSRLAEDYWNRRYLGARRP